MEIQIESEGPNRFAIILTNANGDQVGGTMKIATDAWELSCASQTANVWLGKPTISYAEAIKRAITRLHEFAGWPL